MTDTEGPKERVAVGDVLSGLTVPTLNPGDVPCAAIMFIKVKDSAGDDAGWYVRETENVVDFEVSGVLSSFVHHHTAFLAGGWDVVAHGRR
jgi:hypothetical protein